VSYDAEGPINRVTGRDVLLGCAVLLGSVLFMLGFCYVIGVFVQP